MPEDMSNPESFIPASARAFRSIGTPDANIKKFTVDAPKMFADKKDLESDDDRESYEYSRFERSAEAAIETVERTTLPWVVRMAARDTEFQFVDAPPGLGDNYGLMHLYNTLEQRASFLDRTNRSADSGLALGLETEPWREASIIPKQDENSLRVRLRAEGKTKKEIDSSIDRLKKDAKDRTPLLCEELRRSRKEISLVRKVAILWWGIRQMASSQQVGELYLQAQLPALPTPTDFAEMFSSPSYFIDKSETAPFLKKGVTKYPGYPEEEQIKTFLVEDGRTEKNEALGKLVENETRLLYLISLSEDPEKVIAWKHRAERAKLNKVLIAGGVDEVYLELKKRDILYRDQAEEFKIAQIIGSLKSEEKTAIENAWWKQFGFNDEAEGKGWIGDPEMWIPLKARRGELKPDMSPFKGFDVDQAKENIADTLKALKKNWQALSPLENLSTADHDKVRADIQGQIVKLRKLATVITLNEESNKNELSTTVSSLALENEINLRGKATGLGCLWSKPQLAKDKEELFTQTLIDFVGKDKLAFELGYAVHGVWGLASKESQYKRDYDPNAPFLEQWESDVEGWPYSQEWAAIMGFNWYALYKKEAGGPDGSRGRFGPLMTDYLSSNIAQETDDNGNTLYIIVDGDGKIRKGRADEGIIVTDTTYSLKEKWENGESLGNAKLWEAVVEDPYRRFLLKGFFAEGRSVLKSEDMIGIWKRRDWRLEDLDNDKFWDEYKLARRVALRPELFGEDIWKDQVALVDKTYREDTAKMLADLKNARTEEERSKITEKGAKRYADWQDARKKAVFDYADKTFGDGILSTEMIAIAQRIYDSGRLSPVRIDDPKEVLKRVLKRAERHEVNLGWSIDKVFSLLNRIKEGKVNIAKW